MLMVSTAGKEVGSSGLQIAAGGHLLEELHPNLAGRKAIEVFRSMRDNDSVVGAILFAIDTLVRQVEWKVEQGDAKEEHATFVEECMEDMSMSWGDVISEALSMLPFGFAFHEIVYKRRQGPKRGKEPGSRFKDGKVGWRKLPLRAQESLDHWDFDEEGGISGFVQRAAPDYKEVPIPMDKGLLFRTTVYKNNPEGRSVLRSAYSSWFYKKRIQQIEGTGIERDLAGFPIFWLPSEYLADDASKEQKAVVSAFTTIGQDIRRDKQEFLLMPLAYDDRGNKAFDFTLANSGGQRTFDTDAIIGRYNKEIAMSVLADFILLGHEQVGSFALSDDKTDLFGVALGTFLDIIADVFNRYAIPRLFALNAFPEDDLPHITHADIEKPDLQKLASYIQALSSAGVPLFPDEDLEAYLRDAASLPEKSEETKRLQEEQKEQQQEQFAPGGAPAGEGEEGAPAPEGGGASALEAVIGQTQ